MTVEELIAELEQCPPDAEVFIWADHGQHFEDTTSVELHRDISVRFGQDRIDGLSVVVYGL